MTSTHRITAKGALKLTAEAISDETAQDWLNYFYTKIAAAARRGETKIEMIFSGVAGMPVISPNQQQAIRQLLVNEDGYKVEYKDNYDPKDLREESYYEIIWG